jgi:hypothetical protein
MSVRLHLTERYFATKERLRVILDKHPDAVFIEDICVKLKSGYSLQTALVFWQETPTPPHTNNYFAYIHDGIHWHIIGAHSFDPIVDAIYVRNTHGNEYLSYSRSRRDCVHTPIGGAIDGGRDYTRTVGAPDVVQMDVVAYNLKEKTFSFEGREIKVDE